jgi:hypothetical protein
MPLHQSAMVGCDAAPQIFNLVLARTIPRRPRAPGSALLKAETPKRTPAWGFCFSIRGVSIAAGPALSAGPQYLRERRRGKLGHRLAIKKNLRPAGPPPQRFVLIAFESAEKAQAWRNSAAQKEV